MNRYLALLLLLTSSKGALAAGFGLDGVQNQTPLTYVQSGLAAGKGPHAAGFPNPITYADKRALVTALAAKFDGAEFLVTDLRTPEAMEDIQAQTRAIKEVSQSGDQALNPRGRPFYGYYVVPRPLGFFWAGEQGLQAQYRPNALKSDGTIYESRAQGTFDQGSSISISGSALDVGNPAAVSLFLERNTHAFRRACVPATDCTGPLYGFVAYNETKLTDLYDPEHQLDVVPTTFTLLGDPAVGAGYRMFDKMIDHDPHLSFLNPPKRFMPLYSRAARDSFVRFAQARGRYDFDRLPADRSEFNHDSASLQLAEPGPFGPVNGWVKFVPLSNTAYWEMWEDWVYETWTGFMDAWAQSFAEAQAGNPDYKGALYFQLPGWYSIRKERAAETIPYSYVDTATGQIVSSSRRVIDGPANPAGGTFDYKSLNPVVMGVDLARIAASPYFAGMVHETTETLPGHLPLKDDVYQSEDAVYQTDMQRYVFMFLGEAAKKLMRENGKIYAGFARHAHFWRPGPLPADLFAKANFERTLRVHKPDMIATIAGGLFVDPPGFIPGHGNCGSDPRFCFGRVWLEQVASYETLYGGGGIPPTISSFVADPAAISQGGSTTLRWASERAVRCTIGDASLSPSGALSVQPAATTTYVLRCAGTGGSATATATVAVDGGPTLPPAPTQLTAVARAPDRVELNWIDNSANEDGFTVERRAPGGAWSLIATLGGGSNRHFDSGVTGGNTYEYRVSAFNGGGSAPSNVAVATTPLAPPAAPTALAAAPAGPGRVDLSWRDNASNEAGVRVDRRLGASWTTAATLGANAESYSDTGLAAGTTYYYRVVAFNAGGASTSTTVSVVTLPAPVLPPAAPTELTVSAPSYDHVLLWWRDNANNEAGLRIERRQGSESWAVRAALEANATFYFETAVAPRQTYDYRVVAFNAGGSAPSQIVSVTTPSDGNEPPTDLTAVATSFETVALSWRDNAAGEQGYRVERRTAGGSWTTAASLPRDAASYGDAGLAPDTIYEYRVLVVLSGTTLASAVVSVRTPPAPPAAPSNLLAHAPAHDRVQLTWRDNASNEAGMRVERRAAGGAWTVAATLGADAASYADTGLTASTAYEYRVAAFNAGGASTSAPASVTTPAQPVQVPAAPTALGASAPAFDRVELSWRDNSSNEEGFRVERRPAGVGAWTTAGTTAPDAVTFADAGRAGSTSYEYRVAAFNASGSSTSATVSITTPAEPATIPNAPTGLTASAQAYNLVRLAWQDNASNETGVRVERRLAGSVAWSVVASLENANVVSYEDRSVAPSTAYEYRVAAFNSAGAAHSGPASATTPAQPIVACVRPDGTFSFQWALPAAGPHRLSARGVWPSTSVVANVDVIVLGAPTAVAARATSLTNVNLTWQSQAEAREFRIERATAGGAFAPLATANAAARSYDDATAAPATTYRYRIVAVAGTAVTAPSAEASATTPMPPPNAPSALSANAVLQTAIALSWADNSTDETSFVLERSLDGATFSAIATLPANAVSTTDSGLTASTRYLYRVKARSANGDSAPSNVAEATTPALPPPAAPSGLAATGSTSSEISLSWTDNSTDETGFRLERSADGVSGWAAVATLGANVASHTDRSLTPATRYHYRVAAFHTSAASAYSAVARGTTRPGALACAGLKKTYTLSWNTRGVANGAHTLTAKAYDAQNRFSSSNRVEVNVQNAAIASLSVSFDALQPGATVLGAVRLAAKVAGAAPAGVSAAPGPVDVEFFVDGVRLGDPRTDADTRIVWDTTKASLGAHRLELVARDAAGRTARSQVAVTVVRPEDLDVRGDASVAAKIGDARSLQVELLPDAPAPMAVRITAETPSEDALAKEADEKARGLRRVSMGVRISAESQTNALAALGGAALRMSYDAAAEADAKRVAVFAWRPEKQTWQAIPGSVSDGVASARVDRAGTYRVFAVPAPALSEYGALENVFVYPNPVRGGRAATVHFETGIADGADVRVYDMTGRLLSRGTPKGGLGVGINGKLAHEYKWETSNLASGSYIVLVESQHGSERLRVAKKFAVVR